MTMTSLKAFLTNCSSSQFHKFSIEKGDNHFIYLHDAPIVGASCHISHYLYRMLMLPSVLSILLSNNIKDSSLTGRNNSFTWKPKKKNRLLTWKRQPSYRTNYRTNKSAWLWVTSLAMSYRHESLLGKSCHVRQGQTLRRESLYTNQRLYILGAYPPCQL